jgi:hypothetical protein
MTVIKRSAMRVITGALCLASLLHLSAMVPEVLRFAARFFADEPLFVVPVCVVLLSALAGASLSLVLVFRSWERPGVRSLAVFLAAAVTAWGTVLGLLDLNYAAAVMGSTDHSGGGGTLFLLVTALSLAAASFLRFSASFPRKLVPGDLAPASSSRSATRVRKAALRPWLVWGVGLGFPLGAVAFLGLAEAATAVAGPGLVGALVPWFFRLWLLLFLIFAVGAIVAGTQNLWVGYRLATDEGRRRLLWLVVGVCVSAWLIVLPLLSLPVLLVTQTAAVADAMFVSWGLAPGVLVSAVALALFYSGGVDPSLVLHRSTVLGIVGAVWIVVYAAMETFLSDWVQAGTGLPELVVAISFALVAAAVAMPLRRLAGRVNSRIKVRSGGPAAELGESQS